MVGSWPSPSSPLSRVLRPAEANCSLLAPVAVPIAGPWGLGGPPLRPRQGPHGGGGSSWLWGQLPDLTLFLFCFEKLLVVYLRNRKKKCSVNAREMFSLRLLTGDLRLKRRRVLASGAGPEWPVPGGHRVLGTRGQTQTWGPDPAWVGQLECEHGCHTLSGGTQGSPWGRTVHCGHMCTELLSAPQPRHRQGGSISSRSEPQRETRPQEGLRAPGALLMPGDTHWEWVGRGPCHSLPAALLLTLGPAPKRCPTVR